MSKKSSPTRGRNSGGHKPDTASGLIQACIYRRTSTERQGERVSPEVQLSECEDYARAQGLVVVALYTDTEKYKVRGRLVEPSGSRVDRPGFVQMLADGAAGRWQVIIAWKIDRLFRGVKPAVLVDDLIETAGVTVALVRETFDRKILLLMAAIGRMEQENICERTEMGHRERVRRGLIHGGPVPAGYVPIRAAHRATGAAGIPAVAGQDAAIGYVLDPAWRGFFDDLARYYLQRLPLAEIARRLGANPRTGRPWHSGQLSYFLRNPFYRGRLDYGWQSGNPEFSVLARHAAAWDAETVAAVERELARRGGRPNAPRGRAMLSGILRCGICGGTLKAGQANRRSPDGHLYHYRWYGCNRPTLVLDGRWHGRRTHEPNYINENKCLKLLKDLFAQARPADVDQYLAPAVAVLSGIAPGDDERQARLASEREALSARLSDLTIGLDGVRNSSASATEMIITAITAAGKQLDRVRAELAEFETRRRTAPDMRAARAAMVRLIKHPELFEGDPDDLQAELRAAIPAFYVRRGQLSAPIPEWDD